VFRRRYPLPFWRRLRGLIWPGIGWRRLALYVSKRLLRLPGTPHTLAAGFACGVAVSFTPFIGFHIILGSLLALLVRGNFLAVVIGTLVGNPWTFPFIWLASYQFGRFLLGVGPAAPSLEPLSFHRVVHDLGARIWPMTMGGMPLGLTAGLLIYFPLAWLIAAYQEARRRRRQRRARQRRVGRSSIPPAHPWTPGLPDEPWPKPELGGRVQIGSHEPIR
jgi:uncharacterized protein